MVETKRSDPYTLVSLAFLIAVPTVAHLLFSWMGYNPTDDGFTLAYSRRLLEGQVPHRDFIMIRPFLSPLIHVPIVLIGGEYTYWISRSFVWFQWACISWIWTSVIHKFFGSPFRTRELVLISLIALSASVNTIAIMPWPTVDGFFLSSLGMAMCISQRPWVKVVGYALMAAASLCKQSFLLMAPLALFVLGDWHKIRYWISVALPAILYIIYLQIEHALPDALIQFGSRTEFLQVGLLAYIRVDTFAGILAGYFSIQIAREALKKGPKRGADIARWAGVLIVGVLPSVLTAASLASGRGFHVTSHFLFGTLLGVTAHRLIHGSRRLTGDLQIALVVLLAAWSTSISYGYPAPVFGLGQIITVLIMSAYLLAPDVHGRALRPALGAAAAVVVVCFGVARADHMYREQPAGNLTKSLDGIFPGGKRIMTNPNTYDFLADLNNTAHELTRSGLRYAIMPNAPGYWVQARQINPLPVDWVQDYELNDLRLVRRVTDNLESQRGKLVIIVQKIEASWLAEGVLPLRYEWYSVVSYVRSHFTKTGETRFLELYR